MSLEINLTRRVALLLGLAGAAGATVATLTDGFIGVALAAGGSETITIGLPSLGAEILDYSRPSGFTNENISRALFTNYAVFSPDGKLNPGSGTAETWSSNAEATVWTIKLKQSVKWHDGTTMTADDVVYGVERMKRPEINKSLSVGSFLDNLIEYRIVDPHTVEFRFKQPFPLFMHYIIYIPAIPKAYVERVGEKTFSETAPVGNGPFKLVSHERGSRVVLEAFLDYFDGPADFRTLVLRVIPEASTLVAALKAGEIDIAASITGPALADAKADPEIKTLSLNTGAQGIFIFGDRLRKGSPFNDRRVRQAVDLAIDRAGISQALFGGEAKPALPFADRPNALGMPTDVTPTPYDPERAKALLAEAGFADGLPEPLKIYTYRSGSTPMLIEAAQAVATNLESIGVTTQLVVREPGEYIPAYIKGDVDGLAILGVSPHAYDIGTSSFLWAADGDGLSTMTDSDTSKLWHEQLVEPNADKRRQLLEQAAHIMIDDCRFIGLVQVPNTLALGPRIKAYPLDDSKILVTDGITRLGVNR